MPSRRREKALPASSRTALQLLYFPRPLRQRLARNCFDAQTEQKMDTFSPSTDIGDNRPARSRWFFNRCLWMDRYLACRRCPSGYRAARVQRNPAVRALLGHHLDDLHSRRIAAPNPARLSVHLLCGGRLHTVRISPRRASPSPPHAPHLLPTLRCRQYHFAILLARVDDSVQFAYRSGHHSAERLDLLHRRRHPLGKHARDIHVLRYRCGDTDMPQPP